MASGGGISAVKFGQTTPSVAPTSLFGNPATFTAAANTQASDYDKIMAEYANIASNAGNISPISTSPVSAAQISGQAPITPTQLAPQTTQYKQSADVTDSLADLSNLVNTGGYSDANIADIRARDISPIRSIYANAQENVGRQRALQGGYSPNFGAVQSKMARDEASQIGDVTTNANAGIAQNVASNKIAAAPSYASAASTANAAQAQADQANAAIINEINSLNAQNKAQADQFNTTLADSINKANVANQNQTSEFNTQAQLNTDQLNSQNAQAAKDTALKAVGGQSSLYGTTPALTNMFGNQVATATQLGQNQQQINNQKWNTIGNLSRLGSSAG